MTVNENPAAALPADAGLPVAMRKVGALGHLTLARPAAGNALDRAINASIARQIGLWTTSPDIYAIVLDSAVPATFCTGTDWLELAGRRHLASFRDDVLAMLSEEARLLWQIECCVKPIAALIDGLVQGAGVGVSSFGTHRVAGEDYGLQIADIGLGATLGGGATAVLGRLPDSIGVYLGLTGVRIGRADAYALGLVTHCIGRRQFEAIRRELADADPIDPLLDDRHEPQPEGELTRLAPAIARCFGHQTVEAILAGLAAETGDGRGWAEQTITTLNQRSPTCLKIALRQLTMPQPLDLKAALELEYRVAAAGLARPDFREGLRWMPDDRGSPPRWTPAALTDVSDADVEAAFAGIGPGELTLPPRQASLIGLG